MKIFLEVNEKEINEISNKIHSFQDDFLKWAINDESPAKHPQDLLWYLRTIDELNEHFLNIIQKMEEDRSNNTSLCIEERYNSGNLNN